MNCKHSTVCYTVQLIKHFGLGDVTLKIVPELGFYAIQFVTQYSLLYSTVCCKVQLTKFFSLRDVTLKIIPLFFKKPSCIPTFLRDVTMMMLQWSHTHKQIC